MQVAQYRLVVFRYISFLLLFDLSLDADGSSDKGPLVHNPLCFSADLPGDNRFPDTCEALPDRSLLLGKYRIQVLESVRCEPIPT